MWWSSAMVFLMRHFKLFKWNSFNKLKLAYFFHGIRRKLGKRNLTTSRMVRTHFQIEIYLSIDSKFKAFLFPFLRFAWGYKLNEVVCRKWAWIVTKEVNLTLTDKRTKQEQREVKISSAILEKFISSQWKVHFHRLSGINMRFTLLIRKWYGLVLFISGRMYYKG